VDGAGERIKQKHASNLQPHRVPLSDASLGTLARDYSLLVVEPVAASGLAKLVGLWSGPHQTERAALLGDCRAVNSRGERMRKPVCWSCPQLWSGGYVSSRAVRFRLFFLHKVERFQATKFRSLKP
jgi:hypothetical protein